MVLTFPTEEKHFISFFFIFYIIKCVRGNFRVCGNGFFILPLNIYFITKDFQFAKIALIVMSTPNSESIARISVCERWKSSIYTKCMNSTEIYMWNCFWNWIEMVECHRQQVNFKINKKKHWNKNRNKKIESSWHRNKIFNQFCSQYRLTYSRILLVCSHCRVKMKRKSQYSTKMALEAGFLQNSAFHRFSSPKYKLNPFILSLQVNSWPKM